MAGFSAAPRSWVSVLVAKGTASATMAIGDEHPRAAYIENIKGRRAVETYAKRRCPNLRPGRYMVRVVTPDGVTETQLQVT